MPKVEDIKVINIDNVPYNVEDMSEQVKQLIVVYNEWNQKETDARAEVLLLQSAKNDLSRQIIAQVRKEKEEAETAANEEGTNEAPSNEEETDTE